MNFNAPNMALFNRTLTMDNRHWQGYAFRLALMVVIIFILFSFGLQSTFTAQVTAAGRKFFQSLANADLFFISIFGITLFSSTITEEKEIDSLNLLLMTGIGPFSMVTSKSSSKMLIAMMLIISQFPFTLLAITMGGINLNQIVSVYVTLLCYTTLVANIALFFSVISRKSAQAATLTFIVLILINSFGAFWEYTQFLCPFVRTNNILSTGFSSTPLDSPQVWGSLVIAVMFFTLSVSLFNYFSRQSSMPSPIRLPGTTKKTKFRLFKIGRVWQEPIIWKEYHFCTGGTFGIVLFSSLALIILGLIILFPVYYKSGKLPSREVLGGSCVGIALAFIFIEGVFLSSSLFSKEIWEKTHSSLMLLPLSIRQIAYRKIAGGMIMMIPNVILLIIGLLILGDNLVPDSVEDFFYFMATCFYSIVSVLFYYHLVTFFSLFVKYGAFAIAGIAFYMLQIVFSIPMMILPAMIGAFGYQGSWFAVVTLTLSVAIYLFAIFFLHRFIGKKLVELASH